MATITLGSLTLTDDNAPQVRLNNEYYYTDTSVIIGGKKNITINGVVISEDNGSFTASNVMKQLKIIRDLGQNSSCILVNIPGYYSGNARISGVDIEQGPDPPWVNIGSFQIQLEAPLEKIPDNIFGIVATDFVKSLSFTERLDIGEDGHGYVYTKDKQLSKAYIRFSFSANLDLDPICSPSNIDNVMKKIIRTAPSHSLLSRYASWKIYLQDRSLDLNNGNSISFSASAILIHPERSSADSYVTLDFRHTKNYSSKSETKTTSGNIRGLISVPWKGAINLDSINNSAKIENAEKTLTYIKSKFTSIKSWDGIEYELYKYPDCPPPNLNNSGGVCNLDPVPPTNFTPCFLPSSSVIGRNRTEGSIDFTFEWDSDICNKNPNSNTTTTDISVDDTRSKPTVIEKIIPTIGVLYQNLNCYTARRISFTSNLSFPENACLSISNPCTTPEKQSSDLDTYIVTYLTNRGLRVSDYLLVGYSYSRTNRQNTLKKDLVSLCDTSPLTEICN